MLADGVEILGDRAVAAVLRDRLEPFAGRLADFAVEVSRPADEALAQLMLTLYDVDRGGRRRLQGDPSEPTARHHSVSRTGGTLAAPYAISTGHQFGDDLHGYSRTTDRSAGSAYGSRHAASADLPVLGAVALS